MSRRSARAPKPPADARAEDEAQPSATGRATGVKAKTSVAPPATPPAKRGRAAAKSTAAAVPPAPPSASKKGLSGLAPPLAVAGVLVLDTGLTIHDAALASRASVFSPPSDGLARSARLALVEPLINSDKCERAVRRAREGGALARLLAAALSPTWHAPAHAPRRTRLGALARRSARQAGRAPARAPAPRLAAGGADYILQLLADPGPPTTGRAKSRKAAALSGGCFWLYSRWGRTGTSGSSSLDGPLDEARGEAAFAKLYSEKTGPRACAFTGLLSARGPRLPPYVRTALTSPGEHCAPPRRPGHPWGAPQPQQPGKYAHLAGAALGVASGSSLAMWQYELTDDPHGKPDGWYDYEPATCAQVGPAARCGARGACGRRRRVRDCLSETATFRNRPPFGKGHRHPPAGPRRRGIAGRARDCWAVRRALHGAQECEASARPRLPHGRHDASPWNLSPPRCVVPPLWTLHPYRGAGQRALRRACRQPSARRTLCRF